MVASAFTALIRVRRGTHYIKMQIRTILATGILLFARDITVLYGHGTTSTIYRIGAGVLTVALSTLDITTYWLFAHKYWTASFVIRGKKKRRETGAQSSAIQDDSTLISGDKPSFSGNNSRNEDFNYDAQLNTEEKEAIESEDDPEFKYWWHSRIYITLTFLMMVSWMIFDMTYGKSQCQCD